MKNSRSPIKKFSLHNLIFAGIVIGAGAGYLLNLLDHESALYRESIWWLNLFGPTLFIGALKMVIAPLILASIISGIVSLKKVSDLGRIGRRIFLYYVSTTCIAVSIGLLLVLVIQPGKKGTSLTIRKQRKAEIAALEKVFADETRNEAKKAGKYTAAFRTWLRNREASSLASGSESDRWQRISTAEKNTPGSLFKENIIKPMLENPVAALAGTNSLGIILFALLLGIAIVSIGESGTQVASFFQGLNKAIMQLTRWIMALSPFCILCIVAELIAGHGLSVFSSLSWYCITVIAGIGVHVLFLFALAWILGGTPPGTLWSGIREAWMIAFSTRSSAATLPVTMKCTTENLSVSPQVANFSLPIGATMNMDGTALYEGVAIIFLLQIYTGLADVPIALGGTATLIVFITAVLASIGAAAVPAAGLVTMVLVANAVGLPVYYIPLIFAVDAFLDMFRTSTNVLGDTVGSIVVNRFEKDPGD